MRILTLSYEFPPLGGGGAWVVHGLARELVRAGHQVDVVTMGFRGLPPREDVEGVQVYRMPARRANRHVCAMPEAASYLASAWPFITRLARQHRYDFNQTHFILPDGLLAWRLRRATGLPYVITAHGSDVPGYNPHRLKMAHRLLQPIWRRITRSAATIVCPSDTLKGLVARCDGQTRATVIPNGIEPGSARQDRKIPHRILVLTRMLERKGIQYLLEALRGFPLPYELHVVGEGPYLQALKEQAQAAGVAAKFWGWLDHEAPALKDLYETSSLYVLPSEMENFPMVLLEAMAAQTAIITTRDTGCAEVVGEAGWLVPAKHAAAIREALTELLANPARARALAQAARTRLERSFGWQAVAQRYLALYRQSLGSGFRVQGSGQLPTTPNPQPTATGNTEASTQRVKRVLWIIDYFPRPHDRTTGVWALETIQAIRRQGVEVAVLSPTPWIPRWLAWTKTLRDWSHVPSEWELDGIRVFVPRCLHYPHRLITRWLYHRMPWLDSWLVWWTCRASIACVLERFPAQAVHANFIFPGGFLGRQIKRRYGIPLVVHERSPQRLEAACSHAWRGAIYRRVIREADAVITMNHQMAATLRKLAPTQRDIHVIRSGAVLAAPGAVRLQRPAQWNGARVVLSIGALSERKGHEYLIRAIAELRRELPAVKCLIIGRGPRHAALVQLIRELGVQQQVELCGQRPHEEVLRAVSWCDVFALPSWGESSGTAYAEALAYSKPIIACEGEGLSEVIRNGVSGMLVKPRDVASLAQALRSVLTDEALAARIGEQGRMVAEREMNYSAIARRMISIYNNCTSDYADRRSSASRTADYADKTSYPRIS